ncbi:MAG: hypothetical protein ACOCP8_07125 [archaeon]
MNNNQKTLNDFINDFVEGIEDSWEESYLENKHKTIAFLINEELKDFITENQLNINIMETVKEWKEFVKDNYKYMNDKELNYYITKSRDFYCIFHYVRDKIISELTKRGFEVWNDGYYQAKRDYSKSEIKELMEKAVGDFNNHFDGRLELLEWDEEGHENTYEVSGYNLINNHNIKGVGIYTHGELRYNQKEKEIVLWLDLMIEGNAIEAFTNYYDINNKEWDDEFIWE